MNMQINYDSLGGREIMSSSNEQIIGEVEPPQFQKSRIIETQFEEHVNPFSSGSLNNRCNGSSSNNLLQNVQTILQETMQSQTAQLLSQLDNSQKSGIKKSSSEFLEQKLAQMKQKHKSLQQQLSQVSSYDSGSIQKRKVIGHSKSIVNIDKGKQASFFNFNSLNSQLKQVDVISNMISNINIKPHSLQQKDIEVIIEKSDLSKLIKSLTDQLVKAAELLSEANSEREILLMQNETYEKENYTIKEHNRIMEEELKGTKILLTDTKVELERMKTLFDLLERKYIDLLKKKQEVKIINKETIKEIVIEKPIEIIRQVNNVKIVKQRKEVRKIIKPKPDEKHSILTKLHIVEKQVIDPQIRTIERIVEIPRIEVIEKDRFIDRPVIIERPVDRFIEVPKYVNKEVFVDRPVYIEKPVEKIVEVPKIIEREKFVDRPVFIEKPVDRIVEKETFVDRPVYIQQPPQYFERVVEKDKFIDRPVYIERPQRERIVEVDRPVYIQEPPIERVVEVEKPVYIDRHVYHNEPIQTQLVNQYSSPLHMNDMPQRIYGKQIYRHKQNLNLPTSIRDSLQFHEGGHQLSQSHYNSVDTHSTALQSPQFTQYIPQQVSY